MQPNPYDFDRPVADPTMFFGRRDEMEEIYDGLCSVSGVSFALFGGRRMGKSSVLRELERRLLARHAAGAEPVILPLYIDLDFQQMHSRNEFFQAVVEELLAVIAKHGGGVTVDRKVVGQLIRQEEDSPEPQRDFEEAFKYVYDACFRHLGGLRVALLIDESERIMSEKNLVELRSNLRALLSNRPATRGNLVIVMAGSAKFHNEMEEGSPLKNILSEISLRALSEEEALALIHEPTKRTLPDALAAEVLHQTGGHPCLIQFVMYALCHGDLSQADAQRVQRAVDSYPEKKTSFWDWVDDLGETGVTTYSLLAAHPGGLRQAAIRAELGTSPLQVNHSLDALCFHGVVVKDAEKRYRVNGRMFSGWFEEHMQTTEATARVLQEAILVFDVCDSGMIASKYGDHALKAVADTLEGLNADLQRERPASWFKHRGDGFLLTFANCVTAACYAERLLDALAAYNADSKTRFPVHVRVGLHFGEVNLTSTGERVSHAMNMTVRIEGVKPGHLIEDARSVSRATLPVCDRIFVSEQAAEELGLTYRNRLHDLGYFELKNIFGRHKLYELRRGQT